MPHDGANPENSQRSFNSRRLHHFARGGPRVIGRWFWASSFNLGHFFQQWCTFVLRNYKTKRVQKRQLKCFPLGMFARIKGLDLTVFEMVAASIVVGLVLALTVPMSVG